ncbi:MAG: DUF938 domain-containing protein [Pseudomonadota bacterium]
MTAATAPRSAPAAARNAALIGRVVADWLAPLEGTLLEVGCGTGEHAAAFSALTPHLCWLPSDLEPDVATIMAWRERAAHPERVAAPATLDVDDASDWRRFKEVAAVFSVNTLHIMNWHSVTRLFAGAAAVCRAGGLLLVYGPLHVLGQATSPGNAAFDAQLRAAGVGMGIRDLEAVRSEAAGRGWIERAHYAMPANNQMIVWQRDHS